MDHHSGATLPESGSIRAKTRGAWGPGQQGGSQPRARTHWGEVVFCAESQSGVKNAEMVMYFPDVTWNRLCPAPNSGSASCWGSVSVSHRAGPSSTSMGRSHMLPMFGCTGLHHTDTTSGGKPPALVPLWCPGRPPHFSETCYLFLLNFPNNFDEIFIMNF